MTTTRSILRLGLSLAMGATALAACGSSSPQAAPDAAQIDYVASYSQSGIDESSTIGIARTIPELLPNREFEILGGNYAPNSQTVVAGTPVRVEPGEALVWPTTSEADPVDTPSRVDFSDPDAQSRTWNVTLKMDQLVGGAEPQSLLADASNSGEIQIRLNTIGGEIDVERFESGLLGLGRSLWFLTAWEDQPKDAFGVAWFGGAVARVAEDGSLAFELLPPARRKELQEDQFSIERLAEQAQEPTQQIPREK